MDGEPVVTLAGAADEAMRLYGDGGGDDNEPVSTPEPAAPEAPETAEPEAEPEATPAAPAPEPADAVSEREYVVGDQRVKLTDHQVSMLLRHGADRLRQLQEDANRGPPEPESPPQPEPQEGREFTDEERRHPLVQRLLASEAKLKKLESVDARLSDYEQRVQAKEIVDSTLKAMEKVEFYKDATADEKHELLGEILMLQNVNKTRGMTTQEAVRSIADRYERKINARTEKWKQGKIAAAGQKVEGGGATHATKPPRRGINDLFNGKVFEHAMNFARGVKAD